jgi:bifunctional DNA-binding transcriptional regulator/antitoxin component of YhaV-PrlF toxin-antitoxin module
MKKEEAYTFIAKMDSKGRLRIPVQGREANGYKPGARFNVMILELEESKPPAQEQKA